MGVASIRQATMACANSWNEVWYGRFVMAVETSLDEMSRVATPVRR